LYIVAMNPAHKQHKRLLWLAAIFFVAAGHGHFVKAEIYGQIVPPHLRDPAALVLISGVAEIAGGVGLMMPRFRRAAGWGLIALLISVFPANIYMVQHPELFDIPVWILWMRLPFQVVFIAWVWLVAIKRT